MKRKNFRSNRMNRMTDNQSAAEKKEVNIEEVEEITTLPVKEEEVTAENKKNAENEETVENEEEIELSDNKIEESEEDSDTDEEITEEVNDEQVENIELPKFNPYATKKSDLFILGAVLLLLFIQEEVDVFLVFLLLLLIIDIL